LAAFGLLGYSPALLFAAGLLPHGIFEIPALMLVSAAILRVGALLVTPQAGKSMGQILLELLGESAAIIVGVVWPLLAIAAVIEAKITPTLLLGVLK
jgi:stage II sporulation protein M